MQELVRIRRNRHTKPTLPRRMLMSDNMSQRITRRALIGASAASLAASAIARPEGTWRPKKAVEWGMLPEKLSREDRFKLAKDVGFDGFEVPPIPPDEAEKLRAAADKAGIRIHSIIFGGWGAPMSSPDPAVIERGSNEIKTA